MSDIVQDKKVVVEGRQSPLKDVAVSLRDQIVEKLYAKLDEEDIGTKVDELWRKGYANRVKWHERQKVYLALVDEHLVNDTDGPFDGSSQLHIPLPFIACKTLHARFNQAAWQDPPCWVKARNESSIDRTPTVQDTLRYYIVDGANYGRGCEELIDKYTWDWLTCGSAIAKLRWEVKYESFADVVTTMEDDTPLVKTVNGKEVLLPRKKPVEKEIEVQKKIFDGPVVELKNLEDIVIVEGAGDPDLADAVIERNYLTASEMWQLADQKIFKAEVVKEILEYGPQRIEGQLGNDMKTQRLQDAGKGTLELDRVKDRYEIYEAYLPYDVSGSGITSEVVVWVHAKSRKLLRATYLRRMSKSGKRPYAKADFQPRKGQEYGAGLPELIYPLSKEMDMHHNMRVDFGTIATMPFGFYRASSGIDPEVIDYRPGTLIPVDNPQTDVYFPNIGNRTSFGMQEEQALQNMIERITSVNDLAMGMMSQQGATRTATGSKIVQGEMSSNLDIYLRRLNRGLRKMYRHLLEMLQTRIPPGMSFRLTGDDGKDYWRTVKDPSYIEGEFDIEVDPNSASSNPQIEQDKAQQILQLTGNPMNIQLGLVTAIQHYEACKNYLQSLGVKDFGRYLNKPAPQTRMFTPEEEANRVLRGIEVPVTPEMDHQGFIDFFNHIEADDHLLGQFNEQQTVALARQAKKHEQMLAAIKAQQAQVANAQQMQLNQQQAQPGGLPGLQAPVGAAPAPGSVPTPSGVQM